MKVCFIGLGFVGLPTSLLVSKKGHTVYAYDKNSKIQNKLKKKNTHINEPQIENILKSLKSKKYIVVKKPKPADIFVIAVPTPLNSNKKANLKYLITAINEICPILKKGNLLIVESTSPVGTSNKILNLISKKRKDLKFYRDNKGNFVSCDILYAYCPERVLPGNAIKEIIYNDRTVGAICENSFKKAKKFYRSFTKSKIFKTNPSTAEFVKLTENSFRDLNIAFSNEISLLAKTLNLNVHEIIELSNNHPRINILKPGIGVGGHCLAIDPYFLIQISSKHSRLINQSRKINTFKTDFTIKEINKILKLKYQSKKSGLNINIFGLTYKENINDFRESPAIKILNQINRKFINKINVIEPFLNHKNELPKNVNLQKVNFHGLSQNFFDHDLNILLVAHQIFLDHFKSVKIVDNFYDPLAILSKNYENQ